MQQQQQSQDPVYGRETINGLFVFARSLECIWTLLIREEHGIHYPGLPGLVCGAAILFVAGSSTEPEFILGFAAVWFLFLVARRATAIWKGSPNYSFYAGYPAVLLKLCPFLRTEIRAKNVEPLVCMGISWAVMQLVPDLGGLLMAGAAALAVTRIFESRAARMQVVRMRDAQILQEQAAARFRGQVNEF